MQQYNVNIQPSYMVTVNLWPNKLINNKMYHKYDNEEQKHIIKSVLEVAFNRLDLALNWELTKQQNIHCHFMIKCSEDDIRRAQAYVHVQLGLPKAGVDRCLHFSKTLVDADYGHDYCTKELKKIDDLDLMMEQQVSFNVFKRERSEPK